MEENRLIGNTNTSILKLFALFFMIIDHVGVVFFPHISSLRVLGRIALPLYAWCLVVGCVKTRNPWRYTLRLLSLAIISQPLYMLALDHSLLELNIIFTLTLGVLAITGIRTRKYGSEWWLPALCYLAIALVKMDYGWQGLTFVLLLYGARKTLSGFICTFIAYSLFWGQSSYTVSSLFSLPLTFLYSKPLGLLISPFFRIQAMIWLALPFILIPMKGKVIMPKWLSYSLYPLHLAVIILIRIACGDIL